MLKGMGGLGDMAKMMKAAQDMPVSYTHLDVYKRQDTVRMAMRAMGYSCVWRRFGAIGPGFKPPLAYRPACCLM